LAEVVPNVRQKDYKVEAEDRFSAMEVVFHCLVRSRTEI